MVTSRVSQFGIVELWKCVKERMKFSIKLKMEFQIKLKIKF